ncbi:MAG: hypothetical protein RL308_2508 [Bacteroidota bacterium]|jgi:hypothetical protein
MAGKGGKIEGSGRKPKADEEKVNTIFSNALKTFYKVDTDIEAKEKLVHTLLESQRGQIFISEHLFGKPKETIEATHNVNDFNIKEIFKIGNKSE